MKNFAEKRDQAKRDYNYLIERKTALTAERQDGITMYEDAYERIQPGDEEDVRKEQQRLRAESEMRVSEAISKIYGDSLDPKTLSDATKEIDLDLAMDRRVDEHRKLLYSQRIRSRKRNHIEER